MPVRIEEPGQAGDRRENNGIFVTDAVQKKENTTNYYHRGYFQPDIDEAEAEIGSGRTICLLVVGFTALLGRDSIKFKG